jgi:hypothetical protein
VRSTDYPLAFISLSGSECLYENVSVAVPYVGHPDDNGPGAADGTDQ